MSSNAFKRLALLLPIWGILLGTLVVAIPKGRIQAQAVSVYPEIQVPDEETDFSDEHFQLEEVFFQLEEPDYIIHNARHFYCRQRAIPPVLAVVSAPLITARAVHNTGRYVLRHTAAPADVPLSSQYDYLFLLTPF